MPTYSLFIPFHPNLYMKVGMPSSVTYCVKTSVPQTQGVIKPLAKIYSLAVTRPLRLSNSIFHFEEGSGNTREANGLNRSLFF